YSWHVLLNPKYKGSSTKRPQLYLALMVNKLNDDLMSDSDHIESSMTSSTDNQFTRPLKRIPKAPFDDALPRTSLSSTHYEFDTNLKVKYQNKFFYIWDTNVCVQNDCHQMLFIHVNIQRPRNLLSLFGEKP